MAKSFRTNSLPFSPVPNKTASLADDVRDYIAANLSVGMKGSTLTSGAFNDSNMNQVTVYDAGGAPPDKYIAVDELLVHIEVRRTAQNYIGAMWDARQIFHLLNRKFNFTFGDQDVLSCFALSQPQNTGLDAKNRWLVTCSYIFKLRNA